MSVGTLELLRKNKFVIDLIWLLTYAAFLIANVMVFIIITYYYSFKSANISTLILIAGILVATLLLKSDLFYISSKKNKKSFVKKISTAIALLYEGFSNFGSINGQLLKGNKWNFFLVFIKSVFFSVMNELFLVLIFWTIFILSLHKIYPTIFIDYINFTDFVGILTLIGVLAGIFQYYIKAYKDEQLPQSIQPITNLYLKQIELYSFGNFLKYLKDNNKISHNVYVYNQIKKFLDNRVPGIKHNINQRTYHEESEEITYNFTPDSDTYFFMLIELYAEINDMSLTNVYREFFEKKNEEFINKIDEEDLSRYKKLLLSNFVFYNEMMLNVNKFGAELEIDDDEDEPQTYTDFLKKAIKNNVFYLIDKVLYYNESSENLSNKKSVVVVEVKPIEERE